MFNASALEEDTWLLQLDLDSLLLMKMVLTKCMTSLHLVHLRRSPNVEQLREPFQETSAADFLRDKPTLLVSCISGMGYRNLYCGVYL